MKKQVRTHKDVGQNQRLALKIIMSKVHKTCQPNENAHALLKEDRNKEK